MFYANRRRVPAILSATMLIVLSSKLVGSAGPAAPDSLVVFLNTRGTFIVTGNSLGLAGDFDANGPGIADSIHTFVTLDNGSVDDVPPNPANPWPNGTTFDWSLNSSAAFLTIPAGATVVRAQLIWGGSYRYIEDVSAFLNDDVDLMTPMGSFSIPPEPGFSTTLDLMAASGYSVAFYLRTADVTTQVASGGSGVYSVASVPATQHEMSISLNAVGWTLVVVVAEDSWSCRTLALDITGAWIEESESTTVLLGLATPAAGDVEGRLITGAIDGDANRTGDGAGIRDPGSSAFLALSGPNNPVANFFASQINTENGFLDTSGTWGNANHNAAAGTNVSGGRQGWDHTGVPLGSMMGTLANGQSDTEVRFETTGDSYVVTFVGLEADAESSLCGTEIPIFADGFESGSTSAWSATTA